MDRNMAAALAMVVLGLVMAATALLNKGAGMVAGVVIGMMNSVVGLYWLAGQTRMKNKAV